MPSLPTPPKCRAASVHASLHAAFARNVRARPSGCSTFEALWVHLRYGPATRSSSLRMASSIGFRIESFLPTLLFKLRGLGSYPGRTFTHCSCQLSLDAHFAVLILMFFSRKSFAQCRILILRRSFLAIRFAHLAAERISVLREESPFPSNIPMHWTPGTSCLRNQDKGPSIQE